jgi:O-antigen biosynthesis protein WbqP
MSQEARHDVAGYEYAEVNSYITKVGAFIRKYSIDELPQFFNILVGQMSLIGYRPSQPCEHELNDARESYDMYQLRPGITGWAQVNGRDILAAHPTKKAEFDAEYLKKFSLWLDIKIFFMTFSKVWSNECIVEGVIEEPNCEEASVDAPLAEGAESTIVAAATTEVESDAEEEKEVVLK